MRPVRQAIFLLFFMHFVGARKGAGMPEYPHHPFQRASVSPTESGAGIRVEETLVQAALAIQQLAAGTEEGGRFEGWGWKTLAFG